jgi:hypothetical protein
MRRQWFILLALSLLVAAPSANAQTPRLSVNVPFDFIVGGETLSAGEYTIESLNIDGRVLSIRDFDGQAVSMVISNRCQSLTVSEQTKLVFHRYGNDYFLAQIWVAGNSSGHELPYSIVELELSKDFTARELILAAR